MDVINLLSEQGAVDELGIGIVRDAFANYFFPGTSTIQTRAKYFLIVPYILKEAVDGRYGKDINKIMKANSYLWHTNKCLAVRQNVDDTSVLKNLFIDLSPFSKVYRH